MKLILGSAFAAALAATSVQAAPQVHQIIYNVNAASTCSRAAHNEAELKVGLAACNTALSDPAMIHRAALLLDRGVIHARLSDNPSALRDYNDAIALDSRLADAYVSRAGVLVTLKRYDEASADISRGMALGTSNRHVAYYTSGVIAEEKGDVKSAYQNYKQAAALKPDFAPANRELARFKVVSRTASN